MIKRVLGITTISAITIFFILCCIFNYILADWPIDDGIAAGMNDRDWLVLASWGGISVMVYGSVFVLVSTFIVFLIFRYLIRSKLALRMSLYIMASYESVLLIIAILGSIKKYINKSFM